MKRQPDGETNEHRMDRRAENETQRQMKAEMRKPARRFAEPSGKAAWMLPTPPVQAIARGRLPRPSQPCVARPARGASGGS